MLNSNSSKFLVSSIYSGIGIGLVLGLIMGLSVSPTVQTVIVALTGMLAAMLGLENKIGKTETNESTSFATNLKLGSFGFGVIFGILFGITVRSHNMFAPTTSERVQSWKDAGFDSISAKKYVLFEKLGIDPITGESTLESDQIQRGNTSILFNTKQIALLGVEMDTTQFYNDIQIAIEKFKIYKNKPLDGLLSLTSTILPKDDHMVFLEILQRMIFETKNVAIFCALPNNMNSWDSDILKELSLVLNKIDEEPRKKILYKIRMFFCKIEKK